MKRYEKYNLTPEQQKIVDDKVRDLERTVKNLDLNNLPQGEPQSKTFKSKKGSTEKA